MDENSFLCAGNDIYQLGVMLFKIVQNLHFQTNLPFVTLNSSQKVKKNLKNSESLWSNIATIFAQKNVNQ